MYRTWLSVCFSISYFSFQVITEIPTNANNNGTGGGGKGKNKDVTDGREQTIGKNYL